MRFSAIVPILLGLAALVLSFLCLFAGSTPTFLEDYPIITLNTSQIGENALNSSLVNSNPDLAGILDVIPDSIQDRAEDLLNTVARRLGLRDYYSAHLMTYCEGFYEPGPVPNATLSLGDIDRNTTYCSNRTANNQFDPREALQRNLNESGNSNINISDLNWPDQIDQGLDALHAVQRAAFIIYCVSIGLIALATIVAIISIVFSGRLSAFGNMILAFLAFLAIGVASGLVTAIGVVGVRVINQYAEQVGIQAQRGNRFLALTWAATACMFICLLWWTGDCIVGRRNRGRKNAYAEKQPY
ncbi:SUR7 family protein pun1 [Elsinoe australis]|uniref:SUR7 family protein pun1 n=1 Tax=Elsinoe australis TaxID=40998 RepID=A0A2P7Z1V4_9PEZI|nr:SUR7 family protein pun1 [Elsinoe australis]TKX22432.1 SUR7 family protein pun1 [Elsinoe australis]